MAGGGLLPEHVPWLARAGIRAFHIGSAARPLGSWKAYVDPDLVRSWRRLVDDARIAGRRRDGGVSCGGLHRRARPGRATAGCGRT